ncbi:uncharacterized protein LOC122306483 [Carya illinoinensis]|uniref:uncharacterized protein LOC122306483 n=1 Tax=Carya illinoinensis TaxID=32201 RepID=UPI001C722708|nr:uncharacterized protein LOC122306483 [Carya illinoinensis]
MWGIQAPQATKALLWRAAKESLATNMNLHKRKVVESPLCPICLRYPESVSHALWTCAAAQDVWLKSSRRVQKLDILNGSFKAILMPFWSQLSKRELTEVAITAKAIWHRRNTWFFEKKFQSPSQVSKQVHAEMVAIGSRSKVGIGVIVRDSEGLVIASLCSSITLNPNPMLGEAVAALRATILCAELGLTQIIIEGDALNVVQAVQSEEENWNAFGMVIRDVKSLLSKVREWSIQHTHREFNVIAHTLAKYALTCSDDCILLEDYPPCIQHLL